MSSTAAELVQMLRARYPSGSGKWAVFEEVRNCTGTLGTRACDVLAMALWPSDGLEVMGFEVKVSRADWLAELRDPDKSEAFKRYCDRWWLVVGAAGIARPDELPEGWGLLRPRAGKLVVSRGAPKLEPEAMPRGLLAAVLKRASGEDTWPARLAAAREQGVQEGLERERERSGKRAAESVREHEGLRASVLAFQEASGLEISRYNGPHLGVDVQAARRLRSLVKTDGFGGVMPDLRRRMRRAEQLVGDAGRHVEEAERLVQALLAEPEEGA